MFDVFSNASEIRWKSLLTVFSLIGSLSGQTHELYGVVELGSYSWQRLNVPSPLITHPAAHVQSHPPAAIASSASEYSFPTQSFQDKTA